MENIFRNKRLIMIAFFTAFSVAAVPAAMANDGKRPIPVEMKFMGYIKNYLLIKLNFVAPAENNEFTILIRDNHNNLLYRDNIKGEVFSKSFLLNTEEIGDDSLQFEIINKKTRESVVYEVNRNSGLKAETTISELK